YVLEGFVLEFLHYSEPGAINEFRTRTMNDPGLTHLSIGVDDIYATAKKAVEYGGAIIEDSDVGAAIFIRDPDGQLLELLPTAYREPLPPRPCRARTHHDRGSRGNPSSRSPTMLRWISLVPPMIDIARDHSNQRAQRPPSTASGSSASSSESEPSTSVAMWC